MSRRDASCATISAAVATSTDSAAAGVVLVLVLCVTPASTPNEQEGRERASSLSMDVASLCASPHGTILRNHSRSVVTFNAKP